MSAPIPASAMSQPTLPAVRPSVRLPYHVSITMTNGEQKNAFAAQMSTMRKVGASERTCRQPSMNPVRRSFSSASDPRGRGAMVKRMINGPRKLIAFA